MYLCRGGGPYESFRAFVFEQLSPGIRNPFMAEASAVLARIIPQGIDSGSVYLAGHTATIPAGTEHFHSISFIAVGSNATLRVNKMEHREG